VVGVHALFDTLVAHGEDIEEADAEGGTWRAVHVATSTP